MPGNEGQGDTEVIEFESLDLETEDMDKKKKKEEALALFLKEKLSEEDFTNAAQLMGIETGDLSNAELLEKLTELLQGKKKEEDEYPPPEDEEKKMADYKAFIKDCMKDGEKSMTECAEEWKKKYPEAKEEGETELQKEEDKKKKKPEDEEMAALQARIEELENANKLAKIDAEISELVHEKHLAPIQKEPLIKLSARLSDEDRNAILDVFKTQKFKVDEDVGSTTQTRPGETGYAVTPEERARIMKEHGLNDLIADKAVKKNN